MLRTKIQYLDLENNLKTILLTSPQLKEGKTFLSLQLARAYAAAGKKVVLVDADLRKELHHFEETPSEKGITNVIVGSLELADAFVDTDMELLKYLPSGPLPPNPSEMLDSSGMKRVLAELDKDFDVIILDSSPICMFSDPLVLASKVDGVILVAAARTTSSASLKAANELLMGPNINLMGIVLNKIKVSRQRYYYYDYYRRGKKKRMEKGRG
jgi:capsular exopolysaccharide synthesis family protein